MKIYGKDVALMGILASLIIVCGFIELAPIVGATSYRFSLGSVAINIVSILLGPVFGGITTFVGSLAGQFLTGQGGPFPMFVPATFGAVVTGLLVWGRFKEGVLLFGGVIVSWYLFPVGREVWYYPYLHIIAIVTLIIFHPIFKRWLNEDGKKFFAAILVCCLSGLLCDQLVGSIIAMPIFNLSAAIYKAVLFIYPVERIVLAIISAVVAVPIIKAVSNTPLNIIKRR
ncbi:MAG: ECF transporter S component family protein [Candidatus Methanofastidiosia archaeon]